MNQVVASLIARGVTVTRPELTVLADVDVALLPGRCVGIVGPNGVGKSTLLQVLAGIIVPDRGTVTRTPPSATVGYLTQETERREGETARAFVLRRTGVTDAQHALDESTAALAAGAPGADDRYSTDFDRWLHLGGADIDVRIEQVAHELGIDESIFDRAMTSLSGGQAARVQLASILLSRYDVLLLDEPTNDLDFDGLGRLEAFVRSLTQPVALVSHDRTFLERTITDVVELDEHSRTASHFAGGWTAYLDERATARRHAEEAFDVYVTKRAELTERARRERMWATKGVAAEKRKGRSGDDPDKVGRKFRQEKSEQLAARASRTERALERLDTVDKPWEGWDLRLEIAAAPRAGAVAFRLVDAVVVRGSFRLGPVSLEIGSGERVAIVGPNGSGKSTLLAALLGRIALTSGERWVGPAVVVGEIDQRRQSFETDGRLLEAFCSSTSLPIPEARTLLAKFGLGAEHVTRSVTTLSPGERTRATLAVLQAVGVNTLVLDEPTNHLDLPAIEQIEQALERFEGTVLLVSHDRRLLDTVRIERWIDVADGQVSERLL